MNRNAIHWESFNNRFDQVQLRVSKTDNKKCIFDASSLFLNSDPYNLSLSPSPSLYISFFHRAYRIRKLSSSVPYECIILRVKACRPSFSRRLAPRNKQQLPLVITYFLPCTSVSATLTLAPSTGGPLVCASYIVCSLSNVNR